MLTYNRHVIHHSNTHHCITGYSQAAKYVRTVSYIHSLFPPGHNSMPCLWSRTLTKCGINHNVHSVLLVAICNQMILQVGWEHNHLQRDWRNSSYQCYYHKEEVHTVTLTHPYLDRHTQIHTRVLHMREHPATCPVWDRGSSCNIIHTYHVYSIINVFSLACMCTLQICSELRWQIWVWLSACLFVKANVTRKRMGQQAQVGMWWSTTAIDRPDQTLSIMYLADQCIHTCTCMYSAVLRWRCDILRKSLPLQPLSLGLSASTRMR